MKETVMSAVMIRFCLGLTVLTLLTGCQFKLRGAEPLPFVSALVVAPEGSILGKGLRQSLNTQGKLATSAQTGQIHIQVLAEKRSKDILSLSGAGKVREYRLTSKATLKVTDLSGNELVAPIALEQVRDFSHDNAQTLATEATEAALSRSMDQEMLRQAMRRLAYLKN
jgi:LPS-assembly lipoprotein